jgi:hypothetical protein
MLHVYVQKLDVTVTMQKILPLFLASKHGDYTDFGP